MAHQTIVVGAGLAGLSAAYELARAGYDVQVFEAQERVGGRVHTVQLGAGQYGDLGAEFVDGNHTAVMTYAAEFGLKLDPACRFPDDLYWWVSGVLRNRMSLTAEQSQALDDLSAKLADLEEQAEPRRTLDEWLETHEIAPFASWLARLQARALFTADSESIGIGFFASFSGIDSRNMRIHGGSSCLVDALASRLGERVHTGTPVRRIQQTKDSVTVGIETVNGLVEVVADSAIVAIPWSVLRHIPLEIPLTDIQQEAIATLPYGAVVKTLLQYPERFWSQLNLGIVLLEGEYQAIWEPTFAQPGTMRILSCFSGGTPSLQLGQQAIDKAQQTVRTVYPQAPEAITCLSYDWNADEWVRGAYCYFRPGQMERLHPYLSLPTGRVFFAGEHTAPVEYSGYMEGALRSGQHAAQQVLEEGRLG